MQQPDQTGQAQGGKGTIRKMFHRLIRILYCNRYATTKSINAIILHLPARLSMVVPSAFH